MCRRRRSVSLCSALLLLATSPAATTVRSATSGDPLSRVEFDKELSVNVKDAGIIDVFRVIAQLTQVPFVLDFENDPALNLTFQAKNMVCRGILASLANASGFEFFSTEEGVVVRRRGYPPAVKRITVGAWPPRRGSGPLYELNFRVVDSDRRVVFRRRISMEMGVVGQLKLGLKGHEVRVLDRDRSIAEPRYIGGLELAICIKRDTGAGLDLLLEVISSRPIDDASYTEEHSVVQRTVAAGESLLFKTGDGHQVLLADWSRPAESSLKH